jgi:hypothetical protein
MLEGRRYEIERERWAALRHLRLAPASDGPGGGSPVLDVLRHLGDHLLTCRQTRRVGRPLPETNRRDARRWSRTGWRFQFDSETSSEPRPGRRQSRHRRHPDTYQQQATAEQVSAVLPPKAVLVAGDRHRLTVVFDNLVTTRSSNRPAAR